MAQDELQRAVDEMRVSDAIVVFGAGASFQAGMPLGGQLPPLVWHTLDAHPQSCGKLPRCLVCLLAQRRRPSAMPGIGFAWRSPRSRCIAKHEGPFSTALPA